MLVDVGAITRNGSQITRLAREGKAVVAIKGEDLRHGIDVGLIVLYLCHPRGIGE